MSGIPFSYSSIGSSGYSGYSGTSGYSGYSGYSGIGTSGYSGYSGVSGSAAASGYSGYSGFSGNAATTVIVTYSNSFSAGQAIYRTSGGYALAQANAASATDIIGVVTAATGSQFTYVANGYTTGFTGLVDGAQYYLSDTTPGLVTTTVPTANGSIIKPVMIAIGTTAAQIVEYPGTQIGTGAIGGNGTSGYLAKFTAPSTEANSIIQDNGSLVTVNGNLTATGNVSATKVVAVAGTFTLDTTTGGFNIKGVNGTPPNLAYLANNYFPKLYTRADSPFGVTVFDQTSAVAIQAADLTNGVNAQPLLLNPYGGNVGIGTTSPQTLLDVQTSMSFGTPYMGGSLVAFNVGDNVPATSGSTQNGSFRLSGGTGNKYVIDMGVSNTNGYGWMQVNNNYNLNPAYTHPLILNPNGGNVGIGTTTFTSGVKTIIQGTQTGGVPATSGTTQTYGLLRLQGTTYTAALDFGTNGGTYGWIQYTDQTDLSTCYPLLINPNGGNVGIGTGTTAPSYKLTVEGGSATGGDLIRINSSNGNGTSMAFSSTSTNGRLYRIGSNYITGIGEFDIYDATASTTRVRVSSSGNVGIGALTPAFTLTVSGAIQASGNVGAYSDERVKKNWRDLGPDFVDQLAEIKSGVYDRVDVELTQVGVGAQSLQKILPEAVMSDPEGNLSVTYGNAALAICVELAKEIKALKAEIQLLKSSK
jgi:hypothetical protein